MAEGIVAVLQYKVPTQPNPHKNKKWKMYAVKQIKICAEYRDMIPKVSVRLTGTDRNLYYRVYKKTT